MSIYRIAEKPILIFKQTLCASLILLKKWPMPVRQLWQKVHDRGRWTWDLARRPPGHYAPARAACPAAHVSYVSKNSKKPVMNIVS